MKTLLRAAAVALVATLGVGACSKAATTQALTCGTGTHSDGQGTCQLDNALTLDNVVGTNYWQCDGHDGSGANFPVRLSIGAGGSAILGHVANTGPDYTLTWQEGPASDGITFSANSVWDSLKNIVPSSPTGAQTFTALAFKGGVQLYSSMTCVLSLGTA
jgi:hypothetical protein